MIKVFISHRSLDNDVCSYFKDMLVVCGINQNEIMYTSSQESGVVYQISPEIKQAINESIVDIIFLSPDYLKSIYCCSEMGALAMKSTPTIIFGIKGIEYDAFDSLQGREIYIRNFANQDDLIKVLDIIEGKLGINSSKANANEQAKKVVANYNKVMQNLKNKQTQDAKKEDITTLLNIIENNKIKIRNLENVNRNLNSKLDLNNSLGLLNEKFLKNISISYFIDEKPKTKEISRKELFFLIFANREQFSINDVNIAHWLGNFLNINYRYKTSIYDKGIGKKYLEIDEKFIQRYMQELITYNLINKKSKRENQFFTTNYYELTTKGIEFLNKITRELDE